MYTNFLKLLSCFSEEMGPDYMELDYMETLFKITL